MLYFWYHQLKRLLMLIELYAVLASIYYRILLQRYIEYIRIFDVQHSFVRFATFVYSHTHAILFWWTDTQNASSLFHLIKFTSVWILFSGNFCEQTDIEEIKFVNFCGLHRLNRTKSMQWSNESEITSNKIRIFHLKRIRYRLDRDDDDDKKKRFMQSN